MGDTLTAGMFWGSSVNSHSPVSRSLLEGGASAWPAGMAPVLSGSQGVPGTGAQSTGNSRHWEGAWWPSPPASPGCSDSFELSMKMGGGHFGEVEH